MNDQQRAAMQMAREALEETNGLLTAMLHEQRPQSEIMEQIHNNRTALREVLAQPQEQAQDYIEMARVAGFDIAPCGTEVYDAECWGYITDRLFTFATLVEGEYSKKLANVFCEYCGGNDETPQDHCMDCERPLAQPQGKGENNDVSAMADVEQNRLGSGAKDAEVTLPQGEPQETPYGKCPICGANGVNRERGPNGNDTCANGHSYKSSLAVKVKAKGEWVDLAYAEITEAYWSASPDKHVHRAPRKGIEAVIAKFKEKNTPPVVLQGEPVAMLEVFSGWEDKYEVQVLAGGAAKSLPDGEYKLYTIPSVEAAVKAMRDAAVKALSDEEARVEGIYQQHKIGTPKHQFGVGMWNGLTLAKQAIATLPILGEENGI